MEMESDFVLNVMQTSWPLLKIKINVALELRVSHSSNDMQEITARGFHAAILNSLFMQRVARYSHSFLHLAFFIYVYLLLRSPKNEANRQETKYFSS